MKTAEEALKECPVHEWMGQIESNPTVEWIESIQLDARAELEQELFDLKNQCGICVCPPHCHDEACASCITEKPSVFAERDHWRTLAGKLVDFTEHKPKCSVHRNVHYDCTCGLTETLKEMEGMK